MGWEPKPITPISGEPKRMFDEENQRRANLDGGSGSYSSRSVETKVPTPISLYNNAASHKPAPLPGVVQIQGATIRLKPLPGDELYESIVTQIIPSQPLTISSLLQTYREAVASVGADIVKITGLVMNDKGTQMTDRLMDLTKDSFATKIGLVDMTKRCQDVQVTIDCIKQSSAAFDQRVVESQQLCTKAKQTKEQVEFLLAGLAAAERACTSVCTVPVDLSFATAAATGFLNQINVDIMHTDLLLINARKLVESARIGAFEEGPAWLRRQSLRSM